MCRLRNAGASRTIEKEKGVSRRRNDLGPCESKHLADTRVSNEQKLEEIVVFARVHREGRSCKTTKMNSRYSGSGKWEEAIHA